MKTHVWLTSSLQRNFALDAPGTKRALRLDAARGERVSFQVCVRPEEGPVEVVAEAKAPDDVAVTIRRVGCVPVPHLNTKVPAEETDGVGRVPGYVPDPLFPETTARAAPGEVQSFWVTVDVPRDARPGAKTVEVSLRVGDQTHGGLKATVEVAEVVLRKRRNFSITHWFYADAISDWYKVEPFSDAFWPICEKYMADYAAHGLDTIYLPVFTPPLDGVKRPTQLLDVARDADGRYTFDWRLVKRWIALAEKCGIEKFEWTHLFTQWGCKNAIRIYDKRQPGEALLWPPETGATSATYRDFLSQFLPALHRFLTREDLLKRSFFHVSDEPHGDEHRANYQAARRMLRELAPWMTVMDALSGIEFGREGLVDMPIPSIATTRQFAEEGIKSWTYFCCGPRGRYLNRLLDTPLAKQRYAGWLFYRFRALGFLHWGYNYWYKSQTRQMIDPFTVTDGLGWPGWAYGDTFVVYPGPDGPIDSLRWEVFHESMQDYALLQTLGISPDDRLLAPLQDFNDFPKTEAWLRSARRKLLAKGNS